MTANNKFHLYVYEGDYGLPSLNVECTKCLLYMSMSKVPVQVKTLGNMKHCLLYSAPYFVHKNVSFKTYAETVLYLNTLNYNLDAQLTAKQKSEALALSYLVQSKLRATLEYVFWIDQRNFEEFTRVWYARALPLPFNIIQTKKFKENAVDLIDSLYHKDSTIEVIKDNLNVLATECLSSLSARLGTSNYFFGEEPTSLDVVIYSYLAPLLKLPFPSNSISTLVALWPNLVQFVSRIDAKYLPGLPKESKYIKNEEKMKTSDDEVSYIAISILTFSAMTLAFGFAVSKGFISSKLF
ncbi:unnamed protein product [Ceutorhynchus assimilis]|uniref:Metaxin n=1 Tax=Ceutorhynchus assimilis TaxID=467358 RepID=A0A9N9QM83_9CUCU|nr:unnamed protein product [Ceutorhynchus assimilis]